MNKIFRFSEFQNINESRAFAHFDAEYAEEHIEELRYTHKDVPDSIPVDIREWTIWIEQLNRLQELVNAANKGDVLSMLPITDDNIGAVSNLAYTHNVLHQFFIDGTIPNSAAKDKTELKNYKKSILETVFDYNHTGDTGSFSGEWEEVLTDAGLNLRAIWPALSKVYSILRQNLDNLNKEF